MWAEEANPIEGEVGRMKLRALVLVCALAAVSVAAAAPPTGKGKPPTTAADCRPQVMVVLQGTLAATPGAAATSIAVTVSKTNKQGATYVKGSQPVTILVVPATKITRQGAKTLAALAQGDRVLVQARACKADVASATPQLTAKHIVAHPATATSS